MVEKLAKLQLNQIIYGLLILLVFVLPLSVKVANCILLGALLLALVDAGKSGSFTCQVTIPYRIKVALWALLILSGFSIFFSINRMASAFNWLWVVGQDAVAFWLLLRYGAKEHRPLLLMKVFLIAAALVAIYGIWQYCYGATIQPADWVDHEVFPELKKRAFSTLENPNILGSFLVLACSYCAGIFAPLRGGKTRITLIVIFLLCVICLLFTFSRGNWVALFWMLFVFSAFFYHKAALPFIGGGLMVLYLGWGLLAHRILSIFATEDTSAELRISYLESALSMIRDHPLGVGWYGYQFAFPDYDFYLKDPSVIMYHSHNLFLNITAELGVIGLIIFIYLLWQFFQTARVVRHTADKRWMRGIACGYIASLVGILISGLTDHTLFNWQLGMLFWLGNALILILNSKTRGGKLFKQK